MATKDSRFAQIYRQELAKNKGFMGAFASTGGARAKEMLDLRRYFLPESGVSGAVAQRVFGKSYRYGMGREAIRTAGPTSSVSEKVVSEKLTRIDINTKITAKNSVVLPAMARDMNLMRLNMQKMVTLSGGKASVKSDMFFKRSSEREDLYESQFRKSSGLVTPTTPTRENSVGKSEGFLSGLTNFLKLPLLTMLQGVFGSILNILVKGGLILYLTTKLGELVSKFISDKEFRNALLASINSMLKSVFGEDVWQNLAIGIGTVVGALVTFNVVLGLATKALSALATAAGRGILGGPNVPDIPDIPDVDRDGRNRGRPGNPPNRPSPQVPSQSGNARLGIPGLIRGGLGLALRGGLLGLGISGIEMAGDAIQPISEQERGEKAEQGMGTAREAIARARRSQLTGTPTIDRLTDTDVGSSVSRLPAAATSSSPTRVPLNIDREGLLATIRKYEGGAKGYEAINRGNAGDTPQGYPGLTNLTVEDVMKLQSERKINAAGAYQIIGSTLKGLMKGAYGSTGVSLTDKFNEVTQDRLAMALLNKRIAQGKGDLEATQIALAQEWAILGDPRTGRTMYPGIAGNASSSAASAAVLASLGGSTTQVSTPSSSVDPRYRTASLPSPVSSVPERSLATNTPENTLISGFTGMMASVFSAMGDMTRSVQQIASAPTSRPIEQTAPIPSPYDSQLFESLLRHHTELGSSISGSYS